MADVEQKPSLGAVKEWSETEAGMLSTSMFGAQAFLDPDKFSQLCFAGRLPALKADLLDANEGEFEAEIMAIETLGDLKAFVAREDVQLTRSALTVSVSGGDLYLIDGVGAHSGARMTLDWAAKGTGFGQMSFYIGEDGKLHVDSECMGRHFIRSVLLRLADELVID